MTSDPRDRRRTTSRRSVRTAAALLAVAVVAATSAVTTSSAVGDEPSVLTPIGGGYETSTLAGFSRTAAQGASGPTVDLVVAWDVVTAAFGDHKPAGSLLGVSVLAYDDQLVEIEAVAAIAP